MDKQQMITPEQALPGRTEPIRIEEQHYVTGNPLQEEIPPGMAIAYFAMGCFWGAERLFWKQPGVWSTAVGYQGGYTPNPSYEEVCSGRTGHTESVQVVFDPKIVSYPQLLQLFWEQHDPTQGMRQGADIGTQYRSVIFTLTPEQRQQAQSSRDQFSRLLADKGHPATITTSIETAPSFYFAEPYHQQYLAKNPGGYCGLGGLGFCLPPDNTAN
ncbi:peptide-methionine (S)-S-oxide reductase MsrA [Dongshaea marina]|uniref:peptide-methionine (S)-S-oxide reductase MsrA n=1 Tax=Dongshaea marina TaxID=2047966 RepID=UPI000D3E5E82|nr:peptide-methionine (S)-S-oxide reductase MsrA [Dongshaea marina]